MNTATPRGELSGMPIEQTLFGQLLGVIADGVNHYLNYTFGIVIRLRETFRGNTEMPRY